ncbi:MAG: hypothetical protein WBN88_03970, partial [Anderseniella sp.]
FSSANARSKEIHATTSEAEITGNDLNKRIAMPSFAPGTLFIDGRTMQSQTAMINECRMPLTGTKLPFANAGRRS